MKGRITVIDDDNDLRNLLQIALTNEGYEVKTYASGDEFIKGYQTVSVSDLYVIDLNLGGKNGFELCLHLRSFSDTQQSQVILISANPEVQQLAQDARADDYMLKPFTLRELVKKVSILLKH